MIVFSMFEFFEPGVAAVAVASAAVCGHIRTKRKRAREKEKERGGGEGERSEKGINLFFEEKRYKEEGGLRLEGGKEKKKETRYARGTRGHGVDGSGWMDNMGEHFRGTGGR